MSGFTNVEWRWGVYCYFRHFVDIESFCHYFSLRNLFSKSSLYDFSLGFNLV